MADGYFIAGEPCSVEQAKEFGKLTAERDAAADDASQAWECLQMVGDKLKQCGHDTAPMFYNDAVHNINAKRLRAEAERDALLAERDRMRAAGDALYESMDCQACRISIDFTFCAQCVADREQWRNLAPARTAEGSP